MQALIYGHSQSGGMGLDLARTLKDRGVKVKRLTRDGYTDGKLLAAVGDVGDPAAFDKVYLYGGGNSDKPSLGDLLPLVQALGGKGKVRVVLPPENLDRDPAKLAAQQAKNAGNAKGLQDAGVAVWTVKAPKSQFSGDQIHMRAGAPASVALARQMADVDWPSPKQGGAPWGLLVAGVGTVIAWRWWRARRA